VNWGTKLAHLSSLRYDGSIQTAVTMMALVREVKNITLDELRADVQAALKGEFDMTIAEFFAAVQSGALSEKNDAVSTIMAWAKHIPADDPSRTCLSKK
jgi:hypothetical protein